MPDYGSRIGPAVGSAGQGFILGSEIGGPLAPVTGPIGAGIGFLSGLLSPSASEQQQSAIDRYLTAIENMRTKALQEGYSVIGAGSTRAAANAEMEGTRRAIAAGRGNQASSFTLPEKANILNTGYNNLSRYVLDTNLSYDRLKAEALGQSPDIQPSIGDYIGVAAGAYTGYKRNQGILDAYKSMSDYYKGMAGNKGAMGGGGSMGLLNPMQGMEGVDWSSTKMPNVYGMQF